MIGEACITNARHRAHLLEQSRVEGTAPGLVISKRLDVEARSNRIASIEAGIDRSRVEQTPQTEARADEQDDACSHLRDDERIAESRSR